MPPVATARKGPAPSDSARRQSGRQIRTTTSRPVNYYARQFGGTNGPTTDQEDDSPPECFPAIQFFTDTITALPKETIRQYTLMKEVEAKVYGPTQSALKLVDKIMVMPVPPRKSRQPSRQALLSFSANQSTTASHDGSVVNGHGPMSIADQEEAASQVPVIDTQADFARRQEFHNLRMVLQSMIVNLDEKNVVMTEANRVMGRQLARIDNVMPHIEDEISEEARLGSLNHWAYVDNRVKKTTGPSTVERARRENVAATSSLAAAAAVVHEGEIAAARGEARREAKKSRQQQVDSEFEDRPPQTKKTISSKGRKPAEALVESRGLGIANGANAAQAQKRRKLEKTGGAAMERTLSGTQKATKATGAAARSTPVAETIKKKKPAPPMPQPKKRNIGAQQSPALTPKVAASPVVGNFSLANDRPATSRARQNSSSLQYSIVAEDGSGRPQNTSDARAFNGAETGRKISSARAKEVGDDRHQRMDLDGEASARGRGATREADSAADGHAARLTGRASKTNTPLTESFPADSVGMTRTRSNGVRSTEPTQRPIIRGNGSSDGGSRHGRSASGTHILKQIASFNRSPVLGKREIGTDEPEIGPSERKDTSDEQSRERRATQRVSRRSQRARSPDEEEEEEDLEPLENEAEDDVDNVDEENEGVEDPDDPDEPRYCYCGRGSYGTMIACENPACEKEWFHLECTGLRAVPNENVKWFCNDCDPKRKKSRPVSRN